MPDPETPATLSLPAPRRHKTCARRRYVRTLTIKLDTGDKILVPIDGVANRAANQILVAKLRETLETQLKKIENSGRTLDTAEIKDLMVAMTRLVALTDAAYAADAEKPTHSDAATSEIGRMAVSMVKSVAEGLATGAGKDLNARLKLIESLGRKEKTAEAIDVIIEPVKP
jgi:hypothetical protein